MDPQLHEDTQSELYISPAKMARLEDLKNSVPQVPAMDSEKVYATGEQSTIDAVPEQVPVTYDQPQTPEAARLEQSVPLQGGTDWWFVIVAVFSGIFAIILVVQVVFAYLNPLPIASNFNTAFAQCTSIETPTLQSNYLNRCIVNGRYVYQDQQGAVIGREEKVEQDAARAGQIVFTTPQLATFDRASGAQNGAAQTPGIAAFISTSPELNTKVVVNNTFLQVPSNSQNDLNLQRVDKFLNRDTEFSGNEPLGEESLVLRAFQYQLLPAQSRTLEELQLSAIAFSRTRSVWGVDGSGEEKFIVKARLFGTIRNNVIMVEASLPQSLQQKLLKETLVTCQQQNKSKVEVQNCYVQAVRSDAAYRDAVSNALQGALVRAGLN